jgi:hypothetical protein
MGRGDNHSHEPQRLEVSLRPGQVASLRGYAMNDRRPFDALIRDAVDAYLRARSRPRRSRNDG